MYLALLLSVLFIIIIDDDDDDDDDDVHDYFPARRERAALNEICQNNYFQGGLKFPRRTAKGSLTIPPFTADYCYVLITLEALR